MNEKKEIIEKEQGVLEPRNAQVVGEQGWKVDWRGKDLYERVENFCRSRFVRGTDVEQYLRFTVKKIQEGKDIELRDGTVLKTIEEKEKFLEEELQRAIIHIARQMKGVQ